MSDEERAGISDSEGKRYGWRGGGESERGEGKEGGGGAVREKRSWAKRGTGV